MIINDSSLSGGGMSSMLASGGLGGLVGLAGVSTGAKNTSMIVPSLRQRIIRYLCVKDKNTKTADELLAAYFHAFESDFDSGFPFTLYVPLSNKLVLYVYEENYNYRGGPRRIFNDKCRRIVEGLSEIASILIDLAERRYLALECSRKNQRELPADHTRNWRKYENIYPDESESILYIMSVMISPTEKLYHLNQRRRLVIHRNR
jgi:hypothetical protein